MNLSERRRRPGSGSSVIASSTQTFCRKHSGYCAAVYSFIACNIVYWQDDGTDEANQNSSESSEANWLQKRNVEGGERGSTRPGPELEREVHKSEGEEE